MLSCFGSNDGIIAQTNGKILTMCLGHYPINATSYLHIFPSQNIQDHQDEKRALLFSVEFLKFWNKFFARKQLNFEIIHYEYRHLNINRKLCISQKN